MPSGLSPISSGLRRINSTAGINTRTSVITPKIAQVARQPTQMKSAAVTIGINTLDSP